MSVSHRSASAASELLERSALLAELDRALAAGPGGWVVLVAGEAGIGKSALVRRFIQRRGAEARFLVGLCDPLSTPRVLGPLRDMAGQVGGLLAARLAGGAAREEVFAALLDELAGYEGSQVVVVEDVQWADEATMDMLVLLGRRLERLRVTLIVTCRDDELGPGHPFRAVLSALPAERTVQVRPAPLSKAAVSKLASRMERAADGLYAITGGNPLLVTEVLRSSEPGVPATVRDLVLARFARLPAQAQEVVRFAAVVRTRTELWLLKEAMGLQEPTVVEACVAGGLLVAADGAIGFRHELIRQVVEESLSELRREELNRRILDVLAGAPDVDLARLAHHARQSGDVTALLRYAPQAAREAEAAGAHREAVEHYRSALRHADRLSDPQRAELLEGYSLNCYLVGLADEALTARLAALQIWETAGQAQKVGKNLRWLSRLSWWAGRRDDADQAAMRAIAVLQPAGSSRELVKAYSNVAQLNILACELTPAIEWSYRAIAIARQVGDQETIAHALTIIGSARRADGDEAGRVELEQAIEIAIRDCPPHIAARAMINLAITSMSLRDVQRAGHELDQAFAFALDHDLSTYARYLLGYRACWRLMRGDWPGAERDAREVRNGPVRPEVSVVPALVALGRLQARRGDTGAGDTLKEAADRAFAIGESQRVGLVVVARAEHAWLCGHPDRAATEAARGIELAVRSRQPWFAGEMIWWLYRAGRRHDVPDWIAEPYRMLLSGDWHGAAQVWERLGFPYEQAEALACSDSEDNWGRALEIFDRLGAAPASRQLRKQLRRSGSRRVPRGPRPATAGNPAHLTARQVEVLTLLALQLSNAKIAARLSLSVRTVDHHVAAVLAKLSVSSRDQAVESARLLGIIPAQDGQPSGPS